MSKNKDNSMNVYKRLLGYVKGYWVAFTLAIIGNILYSAIDSGFTYMLKPLLDKGFIARDMAFIQWVPYLILGAFIARGICNFVSTYFMTLVGRSVVMKFRQQIFERLLCLPSSFYDNSTSGKLLSAILYNVEQVSSACTNALTTMLQSGVLIIGLFTVMLTISWQLTLLYLVTIPMIAIAVKLSSRRMRDLSRSVQGSMAELTNIAEETIEGYRVVRTFGGEEYETRKFNKATLTNMRREMKIVVTKTLAGSGVQIIAAGAVAVTVYLAISPTGHLMLSAGGFAAMIGAMLAILKPMKNITNVNSMIQKGLAGAQSVFELLDEAVEQDTGTHTLKRARGELSFDDVSFSYAGTDKIVLNDINFQVKPGQSVAFVGRSGGGKTTLVSLLPRFYDVTSGVIRLDGIDIRDYKIKDLRKQIAHVSQQVTLFNDTVANNIAYGRLDEVSEEDIRQAAIAANAMEFINDMPDGLNTVVGENGVLLSGGQRQRLAIARAILKDSPILILDEATSALDTHSERQIQTALESLMQNRTTFVIAHRLSTIENADVIMVVDDGCIVESGNHQELLARGGHYAKLHKLQFSKQTETVVLETASA